MEPRKYTSSDGYRFEAERVARLAGSGGIGRSRNIEYWSVKVYTTGGEVTKTTLQDIGQVLSFEKVLGVTNALQVGPSVTYGFSGLEKPTLKLDPTGTLLDSELQIPSTVLDARATHYLEIIIHGTVKR